MLREVHGRTQLHVPKAKDVGSRGVITIGTSFQCAYECEVECCGHASTVIASKELATLREEIAKEAPDANKLTGSFESAEGSKEVLVDPGSTEGKMVRIGTTLSSK